MKDIVWSGAAPGVWRAQAGAREAYTLLSAAASVPNTAALRAMTEAPFPLETGEILGETRHGKTLLRFPLTADEEIYGLGLDFNGLRRNRSVVTLHMDAWSGQTGRTHAPVPFYVSSHGYGVLVNSARYMTFYVGTTVRCDAKRPPVVYDRNTDRDRWQSIPTSENIEIVIPADGAEIIVFAGPTPLDAVRRFNLFCGGGGCLPPKWGLGFTHRTPTLYHAEEVAAEAAEFARRGFPLDFIGLEPGWHSRSYPCSFEWDKTRFPDPARAVDALHHQGVRVNLWFNPYVAPKTPLHEKLLPFAGTHTVWNGIVPDYTLPEARKIFADHLREKVLALGPGIGGFKIDEVDGHDTWLWPDSAEFPSGVDAEQLRQTYGVLLQRLTHDLFRSANERTYGLARGSNAGASGLPYAVYSDSYDFAGYLTGMCSSGLCGVLWAPEVRGAKTAEEWVRRIQMACFAPMAMLNAWASGTKPWSFPEVENAVRAAMLLRMRLLPYLYTTFAQYHFDGTPPIRPMQIIPGFTGSGARAEKGRLNDTANPYAQGRVSEIKNQYLLGDSLLVAPLAPGQSSRDVQLPPGCWYDFFTGALVGAGGPIAVTDAPLDHIPLFVRDGGLIPLIPERLQAPSPTEVTPLEVRHYGQADGEMHLYDDDGHTFAYETGAHSWTRLRASKGAGHCEVTHDGASGSFSYGEITWRWMTPP